MKLLLDVGNTRVKWATLENGQFSHHGEFVHRERTGCNLDLLRQQVVAKPSTVLAANVAGDSVGELLEHIVRDAWGIEVQYARTRSSAGGVHCGYRDIGQLGVDRWLAVVAAYHAFGSAVCVVDAGTAVTVDHVDGAGQHLGGIILPGYDLMQHALRADTGDIAEFAERSDDSGADLFFAKSTAAAISGGSRLAIVAAVEQAFAHLQQLDGGARLVVTGGNANRLIEDLQVSVEHRPALVLDGLALER